MLRVSFKQVVERVKHFNMDVYEVISALSGRISVEGQEITFLAQGIPRSIFVIRETCCSFYNVTYQRQHNEYHTNVSFHKLKHNYFQNLKIRF